MTIDAEDAASSANYGEILRRIIKTANDARRETDIAGWYKQQSILAILFSEFGSSGEEVAAEALLERVRGQLAVQLAPATFRRVHVAIHVFANPSQGQDSSAAETPAFYPDLMRLHGARRAAFALKRAMDIIGSGTAIIVLSPVFAAIAILVKLTSDGPVFFRQDRLGQFRRPFAFLKFRSMHAKNDPQIHQEFMKRLISGEHNGHSGGGPTPVYKMTNDPRVTRIGRFLRRTSLDELPQFINVLKGEMSLVGPRPPIPYEYEEYDIWHRRRVLEIKPGITGLWQVKGRSRVSFDDMVRLDLQYAQEWSLWLDIQILLKTPGAVLMGEGAF
ncbi:MAG: sugar transferase [Candidatus Acidiferrales bacterium]